MCLRHKYSRVCLTWEENIKKSVEEEGGGFGWGWVFTTLVCEAHWAPSLISNQKLVSWPLSVSALASKSTTTLRPDNAALYAFNEQTVLERNTVTKGAGYWHIDSKFALKVRVRLTAQTYYKWTFLCLQWTRQEIIMWPSKTLEMALRRKLTVKKLKGRWTTFREQQVNRSVFVWIEEV